MLVSPRILFNHCYGQYGIAAINVFTLEQVLGVFRAASNANAPFIIQTTPVARDYATPELLIGMIHTAATLYPDTVFAIHLDHGVEAHIGHALESGHYTSVMIDASHDPLQTNIDRTRRVVQQAHEKGIWVEAELGVLSGVEDGLSVEAEMARYTQPAEAAFFVKETQCDSLAIAIGTSHGAYKFSGGKGLQFDALKKIQTVLPGYPLVLHGASAVDPLEVDRVVKAGGQMEKDAKGVSDDEVRRAIQLGICKINIATDLRVLWARVHREFFRDYPNQFDPIAPGKVYINELEKLCTRKFEAYGAVGKAAELIHAIH
ncbi:class II fructose-bisphosphate aldolase [Parapedobacter tibetensis]|uniref:class II fructose-bisphosphate aldolase n=1 Tax=Parapedobacter tibetensis TaxID=2972951 RepID=UPI00214D8D86|nr:class II fructose-bisphosphate aldolase [Parapedobacter tibetensis]